MQTGQLSSLVSSFFSEAAGNAQEPLHKKQPKHAACTSFPLMEAELVQAAKLCFQCSHLHRHSSAVNYLGKILPESVALDSL